MIVEYVLTVEYEATGWLRITGVGLKRGFSVDIVITIRCRKGVAGKRKFKIPLSCRCQDDQPTLFLYHYISQ